MCLLFSGLVPIKKTCYNEYILEEIIMAVRLVLLILIILTGAWCYENINIEDFTKENITEQIKKEKTINAVQQGRERRYQEAERAMQGW